ncbi:MAG TPA: zinc ribbon domain-containing protein [Thermoanaerobaculia bacterium]|nr:zinc ribbon domain-containing protein [Thermoanaerobaculia bacterium]
MPLYEYRCRDCGHRFEILQSLGEGAAGLACPRCRAAALDKQFSTFATASGSAAAETAAGCDMADCGAGACCGGGSCAMEDFN